MIFILIGLLALAGTCCMRADQVVLHLNSGDKVSGSVITGDSTHIVISNSWNPNLSIPLSQIASRETLPTDTNGKGSTADSHRTNSPGAMAAKNSSSTNAPSATNSYWPHWSGEAAVGASYQSGPIDHHDYNGHLKLTYAHPYRRDPKEFFRNIFTYDVRYGKTLNTLSDDSMNGSSKTDVDFTRSYYAYNLGSIGYDKVRLINTRYEDGPGFGYHWITRTNFQANLEFGANYQVEQRADFTRDESFFLRLGEDFSWKINPQMKLTEKLEYFQRSGYATQYRIRYESTLSYALILNLSLNVTASDIYDSHPAQTVPDNDFQIRTSLGIKF